MDAEKEQQMYSLMWREESGRHEREISRVIGTVGAEEIKGEILGERK